MKRLVRFVLLALGYVIAVGRVSVRRFKAGSRAQRRRFTAAVVALFVGLGAFAVSSANAANDLGYNSTIDYALTFDGSNPILVADSGVAPTDFTNTFTMEAWIKPGACTAGRCMIGNKESSWEWAVYNGYIEFAIMTPSWSWITTTARVDSNVWTHVAWSKSGTVNSFYVNGTLADTATTGSAISTSNEVFTIGGRVGTADRYTGVIDEVKLWNTARTEAQIDAEMHNYGDGSGANLLDDSALVGYYDFNEGTNVGTQFFDRTSSGKHLAVLAGATKPSYNDIKTVSILDGDTLFTFPRSYITPVGGWTAPSGATRARALVIAGGGGGGPGSSLGWRQPGGGAGGMRDVAAASISGVVKVTVGQGGFAYAPESTTNSANGQDSALGDLISIGGGGGAAADVNFRTPASGGSGAGAEMFKGGSTATAALGGAGTTGQGYPGGSNISGTGSTNRHLGSGGGGGAGGPGGDAIRGTADSTGTGGAAGIGAASDITGSSTYYAGGGAGAGWNSGTADTTKAATAVGAKPAANSGSGGAGGNQTSIAATSGASGIVIVRYSPQVDKYLSRAAATEAMYVMSSGGPIPTATTDSFTLEAWIKPTNQSSGFYGIMGQQNAAGNAYSTTRTYLGVNNRQIHFALGGLNYTPAAQVPNNAWSHVAVTVTGTTVCIYIDAQLIYRYNGWTRSVLGSYFTVGGSPQTDENDWLGGLDQVKIWTVALSQDELKASMNSYQAPGSGSATLANLKVHYDFNEVSSTNVLFDRSLTGGSSDISTTHTAPSFVENIETEAKGNSRTAVRFTRNYLTAAGGWTVPAGAGRSDALVVAGGGGGGAHVGAGGGAGGFVEKPLDLTPGSVIPIQVGQGGGGTVVREYYTEDNTGLATTSRTGSSGNNSILGALITANGGGRGGSWNVNAAQVGGSGGGSTYNNAATAGTASQGNSGGTAVNSAYFQGNPYLTGGGGGAGAVGGNPIDASLTSGVGGAGKASSLWVNGTYYAGGGGGGFLGSASGGAGGTGGGGAGQGNTTTASLPAPGHGAANTGGGGGGSGAHNGAGLTSWGGNGGSGVIVLSYGGYLDLTTTPKARRATQQFDVAPVIKIKNNDGTQLSGSQHAVTVTTDVIGNLTFNGTALTAGKTITASDGVFDFTGLGFATGVTTSQVLTFSSPDFVDYQVTVAPKFSPTTVQIVADSAVASTAGYFDSTGQFYADAAASTNIRVSDLSAAMASTDVRIDASSTISVDTAANFSSRTTGLTMVATSTVTVASGNSLTTGGALTLTGSSVTINGALTSGGTTLVTSTSSSGLNTIAANVINTAVLARTTFKSAGTNATTAAVTVKTNKGPLVFWADSDGNDSGLNRTLAGSVFNTVNGVSTDTATDGGDMVFGGGLTADASDYPTGYGFSDGTYAGFDSATGTCAKTYYYTGGGKFIARGKTGSGMDALVFNCTTQLWANAGQIDIDGRSTTGAGHAMQLQRNASTSQSEFFSSSDMAPAIKFTAISNGRYGFLSGYNVDTQHVVLIQATGTGGVQIEGLGGAGDWFDIGLSGTDILTRGDIRLINNGTGSAGGFSSGKLAWNIVGTNSVLGYCPLITCANSRVTTSAANVYITTDRVASSDTDIKLTVNTSGTFKVEPNSSSGFNEFESRAQGLAISEGCTSVTIGKYQSTDTYVLDVYANIKINGPIRFYGGRVGIYGNLESTRAGSEIRAKSNGSVYVYLSKTVKTNGGDVVFWSNADKVQGTTAVAGTIWLENSSSVTTRGGKIWLGGGLDDGGADASITASRGKWSSVVSGDSLPDGYAVGYNQADEWAIGVYLDVATVLSSDGGDIFIAGAHGPTSNIGYAHILVQPGVIVDSGSGRIAMWGKSPVGSAVGTQGICLNYSNNSTPVRITSHATGSDAILIYSDSSESTAYWSRGITSAWHGVWDAARGFQGVQILATSLGGGITLTGIGGGGSGSSDAVGVRLDYTDILARSGPITINGMSSSSASSQGLSVGRDGGADSAVRLGGWKAGTTGAVGGGIFTTSSGTFDLTSSTSPVYINVDSAYNYEGGRGTIFGTSGAVSILPVTYSNGIGVETDNFKRAQTDSQWRFGQTTFPVAAASFTLGRVNTSTDIAYYGAVNSASDIKMYGGNISVAGNLTTTTLDARVLLKGKVAVNQTSASTIRTNSGKIVLWSDSDNTGGGNMAIAGTLCSAPTATTCNTYASADGDDIILAGGTADATDSTIPGGYATGSSASTQELASGVQLGTLGTAGSGPKIYSSGGNIKIMGQTVVTSSALTVWCLALAVVSGTEVNAGAGKIYADAEVSAPSSTNFLAGIEFNAWGSGTVKFISSNPATDSIFIKSAVRANNGSPKVFGGNSGTSFTNAAGGGLTLQSDWFDDGLIASLGVTGPIVIEPVNGSFINTAFNLDSSYTFTANPNGLRLGKAGNTLNVTASTAVTSSGPIQLFGGTVSATADLTTTNASEILLKGTEDVVVGGGTNASTRRTLSTTGGPITLWSNSDYSGSGAISTSNFTSFLSRGGKITMAGSGSANEAAPTGFAVGSTAYASGVRLGSAAAASNLTLSSDGGDILIQGTTGRNITDAMGVIQYGGSTINSGAGSIKIDARTTGSSGTINGHGIELGFSGTAPTIITSSKSSDTAIDISGQTSGTSTDGKGVNFWSGDATNFVKVSATGTAGNVSISGSATTSTQPGISMNWARVLSRGGSVTLNSGTNPTAFGNNSTSGVIHLGADAPGGATGYIDINAGSFTWAGTVNARTTGDLSIDSGAAQSFASSVSLPASGLVVSEVNDVRIGNAGTSGSDQNSANVTVGPAISATGNVEVYAGALTTSANITSTGQYGFLFLKATSWISQAISTTFRTNSGEVVIWSDADASNGGNVTLKGTICTAPTATTCNTSATSGGAQVVIGGGAASQTDTAMPGGYASGYASTNIDTASGVLFGTTGSAGGAKIYSSGGNVKIAGQTYETSGSISSFAIGVVFMAETEIHAGLGKIYVEGNNATASASSGNYRYPIEWNAWGANRASQFTSTSPAADSITFRALESAASNGLHANSAGAEFKNPNGGLLIQTNRFMDSLMGTVNVGGAFVFEPVDTSFAADYSFDSDITWGTNVPNSVRIGKSGNTAGITVSRTLNSSGNIQVLGGALSTTAAVSSTGGTITYTGASFSNSAVLSTDGRDISVNADQMTIGASITANKTSSGIVSLIPKSPAKNVDLGASDSGTILGLTDTELDYAKAQVLRVGNASYANNINVSANISIATANAPNFALRGAGNVTNSNAATISAGNFAINVGGTISLGGANSISGNLALVASGASGGTGVSFGTSGAFTPATVDSIIPVYGLGKDISVSSAPVVGATEVRYLNQTWSAPPVVTVKDEYGYVISANNLIRTSYTTDVTDSGAPTLAGTTPVISGGTQTFSNLKFTTSTGSTTLTFTTAGLVAGGTSTVTTGTYDVQAGEPSTLAITYDATEAPAGQTGFGLKVTLKDAGGNTVTGPHATDTVTVDVSDGDADATNNATLVSGYRPATVAGVANFSSLILGGKVGVTYTLTFTVTFTDSNAVSQTKTATRTVTLTPGTATKVGVTTQAAGFSNRTTFSTPPVAAIQDAYGNTVTTSTAPIGVAISAVGTASTQTLTGTTSLNATGGSSTFTGLGKTGLIGAKRLTFSSTGLSSDTQDFTLTFGAAHHITSVVSSTLVNDTVFGTQPVVTIRDEDGNVVTDSTLLVKLTSSNATIGGTILGNDVAMYAVGGVADFTGKNVKLTGTAVAKTLTATATGLPAVDSTVTLTFGAASKLAITRPAAGAVNGVAFTTQPQVTVQDVSGNTVTNSSAAITVESSSGSNSTLSGNSAPTTAVNGVATFSGLTQTGTKGTYVLTFRSGSLAIDYQDIVVSYGAATKLVLTTSPLGFVNRTNFTTQPVITVQDANGNTVENASMSIDVSSDSNDLTGTLRVNVVNGIATFAGLGHAGKIGDKHLTFKKVGGGLTVAVFDYTLTYGAATKLTRTTDAAGFVNRVNFTVQPVIEIQDADGNKVANSTVSVTVAMTNGTLDGTDTVPAVGGVATFAGLSASGSVSTTKVLSFSASQLTGTSQPAFTLTHGAAHHIRTTAGTGVLSILSGSTRSGINFGQQPAVAIEDADNNRVTTGAESTQTVTVSASASGLSGTKTVAASSGLVTYSDLKMTALIGNYTLTYTADTSGSTGTTPFTLTYGAASQLSVSTLADGFVNRADFTTQPAVTVQDSMGNTVENASMSIDVTIDTGDLTGTTRVNVVNGVATFAGLGKHGTIGLKTLTFSKTGGGVTPATQPFTLTYGAVHHLSMAVANTLANDTAWATQPVVTIQDEDNNTVDSSASVTLTATGATAVAIGGTTSLDAVHGVANFANKGVKLTGLAGSKTLTATITSPGTFSVPATITLGYGAATKLKLTTEPTGFVNRTNFTVQPVVTVQDISGNTVLNSSISIDVTIDTGDITGTKQVAAVNGVATFAGLGKAGTIGPKTMTFSDAAGALAVDTKQFTLTHGAAHHITMAVASTLVNHTAFGTQPVVTIYDQDDNVVTSGSQSIQTVTLSATGASIAGSVSMDAADGVANFNGKGVGLTGLVGAKSLTATISSPNTIVKTETVTVTYGAATKLAISTDAADASNGSQFGTQPVILVQDFSGNTVTNSTVAVTASVSNGTLDGTDTVSASAGVATFTNLGLTATAGAKTLTFASSPLTPATQSITAVTGAPTQLRIDVASTLVNNTVFGTQPVVTLLDASGVVVSVGSYSSQRVTLSSPDSNISGTLFMNANNGVADFAGNGIKLEGLIGSRSLVATISSPSTVTATAAVTITYGAAHHLHIASGASGIANRIAFVNQPAIEVRDISGNVVGNSNAQISVAATGANGAVLGGDTSMNATSGIAYFAQNTNGLKLTGSVGTYRLTYSSGALSADAEDVVLTHGTATKIVVSRNAATAKSGQAFVTQPKIQVQDADSNLVNTGTASTAKISIAVSADAYDSAAHTGVNLTGPTGFATVDAVAGEATFVGARLEGVAATYALKFEVVNTAGFNGLATSQNLALTAGTETHLAVVQQPTAIIAGAAFSPVVTVEILDAWNNRVLDVANSVTIKPTLVDAAVLGNEVDATKSAVANSSGLVTFTGLTFTKAGTQFIQFTSTGLLATTSSSFVITNAQAHHLTWVNAAATFSAKNDYAIKDAANANPELEVRDQYENPVLTGNATTVVVTESTSSADVRAISGASISSNSSARVSFANLVMRAKAGSYTLNFTASNGSLPINGDVATATVSISFGDPSALRLTRNAAGANVDLPFTTQPKLNIEDTAGNVVADSGLAVTVSENVSQVLSGTTTKSATAGSVDFTDSGLKLSGTVETGLRLKYAVTYNGTEISTSQDIDLDPGLAINLTIGQQPTTVQTRVAFSPVPTVILRDGSGNRVTSDNSSTVTAQLKDSTGNPVGSETSAFTASGGLVTFTGLAFQAPSTEGYFVTFKLVSNGVAATSTPFDILPGVATELRITRQPSTDAVDHTPGKTGELLSTQPIAKLYDQDGNLVTTANSGAVTVRVKSTDGAGDLTEGTVTADVTGGIATFSGVKFVGTPGVTYTLDFATATPNPTLTSLASSTISVTHNDANHLVVTRAASGGRSGEAFTTPPIITIKDRYQNTVTSGAAANSRVTVTGEVTAPSAGSANLSGASATASGGVATLTTLTLTGSIANTYKLNFGVVGSSINSTSQTGLTISYGYEAQIALITQPVGGNATGTHLATQPAVEIRDSAGNRVANSTFTVAATINSTAGLTLLNGSAARLTGASKPAVAGVASFDALDLYGLPGTNYELKFEVNGLPAITANPIQVNHAVAHHLTITQQPVGGNATGDSLTGQPILQLRDAFENVVSADSTDVVTARLSTTSAREYLAGNSTATLAQGVATFSGLKVIALPATDYTLDFTVTVAGNTITSSATNSFRVTYSTPTKLAMAQQPSGGTTGVALNTQPVIEVQDFYGNRVYNYVGNVVASVGAGATVTNTVTSSLSLAVTDGQAAFAGLAVTGTPATDYQLTFTSGGLASVNSNNIQLTPGAPVRIEILNQPIGAQTGAALAGQPVVKIVDSFGNTVTQNSSTVITAALTSGSGGTLTRVVSSNSVPITATVSNGVATFSNLYMRGLTNHNYQMTFSSGDLAVAVSANYQVSHASVDRLVWNTQPAVGMSGSALTRAAVLELQDLDGNIADTDNSTVVTAVVTSGSGASPLQYATATAANGVVTFNNLILTGTPGTAYKLTFTAVVGSTSFSAPASSDLIPTHAVPAKLTMRGANVAGGLSGANLTSQPALYVRDRFNNIATSDNTTEVTASIYNDSTGSVSGTTTARAVNGLVTFAGLKVLGDPGTPYTLRFNGDSSGTSLTPIDSNTFTVSKVADVSLAYTAQDYVPNARVAVQFSTDSPGDITFSSNASSLVCVLDPGTGDLIIKGVGSCLVRVDVDTDQDGFYLANHAEATLVISKARQAAVTITSAAAVDYWSSLNPVATGGTGTGALSYSVVAGSTCRLIGATILPGDAGSLCQLTATRAGDANYLVETSAVQTIVVRKINQGTLTIASAPTMAVDNLTMFTAGGSGTGAVSYSIVSSGTAHCRIAGDVLSATAAGTCSVRATKAASTNYNAITSASQTITVTKEEQTVAFSSTAPMYPVVAGSYTPVAVATSGLAVTYSIATNSSGAACAFDSVVPTKINFTAEGVCEVVATQAGSSRYAAASVRQIIRVGLLNQTINFDVIPDLAFGTPAFKLLPTTNAGAAAVIGLATTSNSTACSISAGIVTLTAAGYCEIVATQTGYGSYAAATEVIRGFNVLADFAGAPHIFSTSVTTHALTASFTAPSYAGGSAITGYVLIATDANGDTYENAACPTVGSSITCTIVGLPNDIAYTAVARAITSVGRGTASNVTLSQTPMDAPMAVTNLTAATVNNDLQVSWTPPTALDSSFTRYDIFVAPIGSNFSATTPYNETDVNATSTTIQNIVNSTVTPTPAPTTNTASTRISFRRASVSTPASSSSGSAPQSSSVGGFKVKIVTITSSTTSASNSNSTSGFQTNFAVPLAPAQLTLTVTEPDMIISWSAPTADGGSAVTGYDVKVNGSVICPATTSLFCAFNGMQPGRTYNVEVAAINAIGTSAASAASHSVAALPVVAGSAGSSVSANGMAILGSSAKTVSTKGGQLLTLNARNFAGVLSALLDGKPVKIVSNSEDHITLEMPEHAAGVVDLTFKSKIGTLVFQDAVTFVAPPRADAFQQFSRYRATFVATNPKMVASIRAIVSAAEAPKAMVCVGLVPAKYTATEIRLAKLRAANVCAVGAKLDGNLAVRSTTAVTKLTGPAARAVKVTYKY